ncbi:MAG: beta-propeller fold lactonase family protein, partial [Caldilineaceae bacterium]
EAQRDGNGSVTGLLQPSSVTVSPDGNNVYATGYVSGTVVVFARDDMSGTLTYVETKTQGQDGVNGLNGAWSAAMSPDGLYLYVTGIKDGTVVVFARDEASGSLTQVQALANGLGGVTGILGAAGIAISPDGTSVYVVGSDEDSVVLFSRDSGTGELTFEESYAGLPGLDGAVSLAISSDGMNVYVASVVDGTITVFRRDGSSGSLTRVVSAAGMEEEASADEADASLLTLYWAVDVSPDDKYVYAVGWELSVPEFALSGIVSVFAREAGTGLISKAQVLRNDEGAIRGLREPTSLAVSGDNQNVYVTSVRDSATLVFEATGSAQYEDIQFLPLLR